jgi:hypothetical protein
MMRAAKRHKGSYSAWIAYTDLLLYVHCWLMVDLADVLRRQNDRLDEARATFKDLCMKNLDWPEAIWEAWISFEHLHGSVDDIEACLDKIEKAQYQVDARRAKMKSTEGDASAHDQTSTGGTKRKAEDTPIAEDTKKAKIGTVFFLLLIAGTADHGRRRRTRRSSAKEVLSL